MDLLPLIVGILFVLFLLVFFVYSGITIKHAARFRYLSKRTVYLTIFYVSSSAMLITVALILYGIMLFN